jgi:predicted esterase
VWHEPTLIYPEANRFSIRNGRGEFGVGKLILKQSSRNFDMKDAKSSKNTQKHIIRSKYERSQVDVSHGRVDWFE